MIERPTGQPEQPKRRRKSRQIPEKSSPFIITTVRIPEHQSLLLGAIANAEGTTVSQLFRDALDDYFEKKRSEYEGAEGKKATLGREMREIIVYSKQIEDAKARLQEARDRLRPRKT